MGKFFVLYLWMNLFNKGFTFTNLEKLIIFLIISSDSLLSVKWERGISHFRVQANPACFQP